MSNESIGDMIHERRIALGMTLEDVGNAVGVTKSTVRKWEKGMIKNMGRDKLAALARVLNINPATLVVPYQDEEEKRGMRIEKLAHSFHPEVINTLNDAIGNSEQYLVLSKAVSKMTPNELQKLIDMTKLMYPEKFEEDEEK